MNQRAYVVITPVRNEQQRLARTIESVTSQTHRPMAWVIVDDGSSDETPQIVDAAAREHSWIKAIHRPDRGARKSGGGVVEAFYDGYQLVANLGWDFLVKLDGDLSFDARYFSDCLECFDEDATLGIGGGTICYLDEGVAKVESIGDPPFHVRGATKIYRRRCWEDIGSLVRAPGWDTIDEVKANMKGWTTRSFPAFHVIQHKPTGSADGTWGNWFKNGRGCYVTGYDPLFMLAKCARRALGKPPLIPALALGAGFCSGYLNRLPRLEDAEVLQYLRRHQRRRLFGQRSIYG